MQTKAAVALLLCLACLRAVDMLLVAASTPRINQLLRLATGKQAWNLDTASPYLTWGYCTRLQQKYTLNVTPAKNQISFDAAQPATSAAQSRPGCSQDVRDLDTELAKLFAGGNPWTFTKQLEGNLHYWTNYSGVQLTFVSTDVVA